MSVPAPAAAEPGASLTRHLAAAAAQLPAHAGICVACSGGGDSMALLHALHGADLGALRVVHVHHGLQAAADGWAARVEAASAALGLRCDVLRVTVVEDGHGPEAAARQARYAALAGQLAEGEVLAVAHHADDQAETVLLRLLRGSGIAGAAAMPALRRLGAGWLWRPLLEVPRARLDAYRAEHGLAAIEDPHNHDPRYVRSRLRQSVMPQLRSLYPEAVAALGRFAAEAADAAAWLEADADALLAAAGGRLGLPQAAVRALPAPRRRWLLRRFLARHGLPAPDAAWLQRLQDELLDAGADRHPELALGEAICCRHDGELVLRRRLPPVPAGWQQEWHGRGQLALPGGGWLTAAKPLPAPVTLRHCRGGERLRPRAGGPTRTLRNLFQEARMPLWLRQRVPVVEQGGRLLAVGDWRDADAPPAATAGLAWTAPDWRWPPAP